MRSKLFIVPAIIGLCLAQTAPAQQKIAVTVPAALDPSAPIAESVKRDCAVETKVGQEVFMRVSERFPGTETAPQGSSVISGGKILLKVTIVGVLGAGGGAWSGPKAMTIRADVIQNEKAGPSRTFNRQSTGGAFGGLSGTCAIMDRIAVALGRDVAAWLPTQLAATGQDPSKHGAAKPAAQANPEREPKQ